jgi:hypothetical protein
MRTYAYVYVCVCLCVCIYIDITYIYTCRYIYTERERAREREGIRQHPSAYFLQISACDTRRAYYLHTYITRRTVAELKHVVAS